MGVMQYLEEKELKRNDEIIKQNVVKCNEKKQKLTITYMMMWTEVCGGSKVLLEHMNRLTKRGHKINIVTYDIKPTWFPMEEDINFIQVPLEKELHDYVPECDVIVATSWKCIYECVASNKAPVVFFEQGGNHLFQKDKLDEFRIAKLQRRYNMVPFIYTVSKYSSDVIKKEYNVNSDVIPIAIDENIFYLRDGENSDLDAIEITAIGPEDFKFKNIPEIIKAVSELKEKYNINFNWISQKQPVENKIPCIVNPPQKEIGNILRKTDIYVCASEFESFGLPILEAMTCGAAVVTTDTGGCRDFVEDRKNALMIKMHDVEDMKQKIEELINDKKLKDSLIKAAIDTSKNYRWDVCIDKVEEYYKTMSQYKVI